MVGMEFVLGCSGGKDSTASVILDYLHERKISKIIFCELFFDETVSAEYPVHRDFLYSKLFPTFRDWGYEVVCLKGYKTYMDCFYHKRTARSKNYGKIVGFMIAGHCDMQGVKIKTIGDYLKTIGDYKECIGIAADETKRLSTANRKGQYSVLEQYGYTEQMARDLCEEYGLLSPIYSHFKRSGCWFCPNAGKSQLLYMIDKEPELYERLLELEKVSGKVSDTFCYGKSYSAMKDLLLKERRMKVKAIWEFEVDTEEYQKDSINVEGLQRS